jgi:hypothetical protein
MMTQFFSRFYGLVSKFLINNSSAEVSRFQKLQPAILHGDHVEVYQNILDEFEKKFAGAKDIKWSTLDQSFASTFNMDDQQCRAMFNLQGNLEYKIGYGKEKHLPIDIRKAVNSMYAEFIISSVIEVEEAQRTFWVIALEDDKHLISVRVENNEIEQTRKCTKFNLDSPRSKRVSIAERQCETN